ncbi:zinc finger protein 2-like [Hippoglossus hippoglossus]|uniref:zinc finger protein 2-like n=1 Tax=Hippoglossus hippoglossus TaxID=8267 RepID=UPI00148B66FB|nr:zinc finger protein 2-like [Hippoglossus hippoglossus]
MSGDQITFTPTRGSPPRDPGAAELSEMETLRIFVNQRLTAVVEDILAVFGRTVARYREQIDRQQQQLDGLKSEEGAWIWAADPQCAPSWIKACPDEQLEQLVQTDGAEEGGPETSGPLIKCEAEGGEGGDGASDSDTEDSKEYWRPEESTGQRSPQQQDEASLPPLFSCKVCGESFENRGYVGTHTVAHPRDCGVCGKHLERPENLKPHLRGLRDTSFHCNVCGQSFGRRATLVLLVLRPQFC